MISPVTIAAAVDGLEIGIEQPPTTVEPAWRSARDARLIGQQRVMSAQAQAGAWHPIEDGYRLTSALLPQPVMMVHFRPRRLYSVSG